MTALTKISYDYSMHGKIETYLRKTGYKLEDAVFTDKVTYEVYVPINMQEEFKNELISITNAKIQIEYIDDVYIDKYL